MTMHLKPELEELIKQDIQRGAYQSIDEYIEHAVFMLHEQEAWLADHHAEIADKIEAGYAAAQRGELIDSDQVRSSLEERKLAWQANARMIASAVTARLKQIGFSPLQDLDNGFISLQPSKYLCPQK